MIQIKSDRRTINCGGFACFKTDRIFLLGTFSEGQSCIISSSNNRHFFNAHSSLPGFSKRVWITTFRITWESRFSNGFLITLKITIPSQNFLTWCWNKFALDLMVFAKCLPRLFSQSLAYSLFLPLSPSIFNFTHRPIFSICDKLYRNLIKDKSNEEQCMDLVCLECVFLFVAV